MHYGFSFSFQQIQDISSDLHKNKVICLIYIWRKKKKSFVDAP